MTSVEYTREPRIAASPDADLDAIWRTKPGFIGWLSSVDHKEIGKRYIVTAFLFLQRLFIQGVTAGAVK